MIVVMKKGATPEEIQHVIRQVERLGLKRIQSSARSGR